jgi:hypothetical protein
MPASIAKLKQMNQHLQAELDFYRSHWRDIATYIRPLAKTVLFDRQPGSNLMENLYTSTPLFENRKLAASIASAICPQSATWFFFETGNEKLNQVPVVRRWLEESTATGHGTLNHSVFYREVNVHFLQLTSFGQGCMYVDERRKKLKTGGFSGFWFKEHAIGEYAIAENFEGIVDTLFRTDKMQARKILETWPDRAGKKVKEIYDKNPMDKIPVVHAVYPRTERQYGMKGPLGMPFASVYFLPGEEIILEEKGYPEMPYLVDRWERPPGEVYGRGVGSDGLPETKTLNKAIELSLAAWAKMVDPPMMKELNAVIGKINLAPRGVTTVQKFPGIQPIPLTNRLDVAQLKEVELKTEIRRLFYGDQLQLQEGPQMTATEVAIRYELMQRMLGPTLGAIIVEFLNPLIERIFGILYRNGILGRAPAEVIEEYGSWIDIEYKGPMARAQRSGEIYAFQRFLEIFIPVWKLDPTVLDWVNWFEVIPYFAPLMGLPAKFVNTKEEVKKLQDARAAVQAQIAQQAQAQGMMESLRKLGPALGPLKEASSGMTSDDIASLMGSMEGAGAPAGA